MGQAARVWHLRARFNKPVALTLLWSFPRACEAAQAPPAISVWLFLFGFFWLDRGRRRPSAERASSVSGPLARRRGGWRQDQLRVVDDVADMTVVADEADPTVRPPQPHTVRSLQSHKVAGLDRLRILPDRDHLRPLSQAGRRILTSHGFALGKGARGHSDETNARERASADTSRD
jgi:hypothetical protein